MKLNPIFVFAILFPLLSAAQRQDSITCPPIPDYNEVSKTYSPNDPIWDIYPYYRHKALKDTIPPQAIASASDVGYMERIYLPLPLEHNYPIETLTYSSAENYISNISENSVRLVGMEFEIAPDIEKVPIVFILPGLSTAVCRYTQHYYGDAIRLELHCLDMDGYKPLERH